MSIQSLFMLCFCMVCAIVALNGQNQSAEGIVIDVYPVRVNHKSGFVRFFEGRTLEVTAPRYDYVGDEFLPWNNAKATSHSNLKLFELNKRVGLLDASFKEILPNNYKSIRPISPHFFAVEKDSLFQLINQDEAVLFNGAIYDDIWWAEAGQSAASAYFFVKKKTGWGLRRNGGPELIAPKYAAIETASKKGFYKVKNSRNASKWWLIDSTDQKVLNKPYYEIVVMSENLIAVYTDAGTWKLYRCQKKGPYPINESNLETTQYDAIEKLNERMFVAVPLPPANESWSKTSIQLWNINKQDTVRNSMVRSRNLENFFDKRLQRRPPLYKPWYEPLDEVYVKLIEPRARNVDTYSLIDTLGNNPADTSFYGLLSSGKPGVYMVIEGRNANLYAPDTGYVFQNSEFTRILPFEDSVALAKVNDYYTAVSYCDSMKTDQLDGFYAQDSIKILGNNQVQIKFSGTIVNYVLNEKTCQFEEEAIISNGILIDLDGAAIPREAIGIFREKRNKKYQPSLIEDYLSIESGADTFALLERNSLASEDTDPNPIGVLPRVFRNHFPVTILPDLILAYHEKGLSVYTQFTRQICNGRINYLQFYHIENKRHLPELDIIGLRDFDPRYEYTAFLRSDGSMGLLRRDGRPMIKDGKEVSFAYIGPFVAGRARVALNGQLTYDNNQRIDLPSEFAIAGRYQFFEEFNMKSSEKISRFRDQGIFLLDEQPIRWGFIDEAGELLFEVDADHVNDYLSDSTAIILEQNGKKVWNRSDFGLINFEGERVIDPVYSSLEIYEPYIKVNVDSTPTIYFTKKGHQIFMNRTRMRPFSEGLSQFKNLQGLWGYVDTLGNVIIEPRYKIARPFSEGLAMVVDTSGFCSFIDKSGKKVFSTHLSGRQWRALGDFWNGRCWFKEEKGPKWGCYNNKGEIAIPPQFFNIPNPNNRIDSFCIQPMDFKNGVAPVISNGLEANRQVGIIDTSGRFVLKPQKDIYEIHTFNSLGIATFRRDKGGLLGLINQAGKVIMEPKYVKIEPFKNGYARVMNDRKYWGMIDVRGHEVIPLKHIAIGDFHEGLIPLRRKHNEGWFLVDTSYQVKLMGPYFKISPFQDGIAMVSNRFGNNFIINTGGDTLSLGRGVPQFLSNGLVGMKDTTTNEERYYYADISGRNVFARYFKKISPFKRGIASVRKLSVGSMDEERLGAINERGVMVVPPKFGHIHIQADGNVIINPQRFYGLMTHDGKELIPPIYDKITEFEELNLFRVEQGEKIGYVRIKENTASWVWELQF